MITHELQIRFSEGCALDSLNKVSHAGVLLVLISGRQKVCLSHSGGSWLRCGTHRPDFKFSSIPDWMEGSPQPQRPF